MAILVSRNGSRKAARVDASGSADGQGVASSGQGVASSGQAPRADVARWLAALVCEDGCVELRAVGVRRKGQPGSHVESSFFQLSEVDDMARAALTLSGRTAGIYFTLNPVDAWRYSSPDGKSTRDADILSRRWLLVDCDPVKGDPEASATDEEKDAALSAAKGVRDHLRSRAWPDPVFADSGNGYHLLYRIDLPNDDESKALVKRCLTSLAAKFSNARVSIDTSVHNAGRICKLYGTMAMKGEPTEARPHRASRVLDIPSPIQVAGIEWLDDLAREADAARPPEALALAGPTAAGEGGTPYPKSIEGVPPSPKGIEAIPRPRGIIARAKKAADPIRAHAMAAMEQECNAVAACPPGSGDHGGRNNQLNASAFALGQLVAARSLDESEVVRGLEVAASACGLPPGEASRAIASGLNAGKALPRDLSNVGRAHLPPGNPPGGEAEGDDGDGPMSADDDPHRLARLFLATRCTHPDGLTLRYWMERWHLWDGAAWRVLADAEVGGELTKSIKEEFDRIAAERRKTTQAVTTKVVGNALQALRSEAMLSARACPRQPAWLDGVGPNPLECISARNGIVHLPTLIGGCRAPMPPSPRHFSPVALDYDFDPDAPRPDAWLKFLASLWDDDPESVACLQEWFGYLITPDTRQQKMLLIIGPRRSGKGTILRVLRSVVGALNVAAPTLSGLATNFGAAPLIGKSLAIVPDARLSARADAQVIIERLLSITGEDPQTIDRKHRDDWTGDLLTRFAIASNELPRMGDSSGALPGRVVLLRLTRTFYGHEDIDLFERLASELPGICLWAIAGWERLRRRGRFAQPASGQALLDELDELSSPITTFVSDRCQTGSECSVAIKDLYGAWKKWCEEHGKDHPGDEQGFGRNLRAAFPRLETRRVGPKGGQKRNYVGIGLIDGNSDY